MNKKKLLTIALIALTVVVGGAAIYVGIRLKQGIGELPQTGGIIGNDNIEYRSNCSGTYWNEEKHTYCVTINQDEVDKIDFAAKHWCDTDTWIDAGCNCSYDESATPSCDPSHEMANGSINQQGLYSPDNVMCKCTNGSSDGVDCREADSGDICTNNLFQKLSEVTEICLDRDYRNPSNTYCGLQQIDILGQNGDNSCFLSGLMSNVEECTSTPTPTPTPLSCGDKCAVDSDCASTYNIPLKTIHADGTITTEYKDIVAECNDGAGGYCSVVENSSLPGYEDNCAKYGYVRNGNCECVKYESETASCTALTYAASLNKFKLRVTISGTNTVTSEDIKFYWNQNDFSCSNTSTINWLEIPNAICNATGQNNSVQCETNDIAYSNLRGYLPNLNIKFKADYKMTSGCDKCYISVSPTPTITPPGCPYSSVTALMRLDNDPNNGDLLSETNPTSYIASFPAYLDFGCKGTLIGRSSSVYISNANITININGSELIVDATNPKLNHFLNSGLSSTNHYSITCSIPGYDEARCRSTRSITQGTPSPTPTTGTPTPTPTTGTPTPTTTTTVTPTTTTTTVPPTTTRPPTGTGTLVPTALISDDMDRVIIGLVLLTVGLVLYKSGMYINIGNVLWNRGGSTVWGGVSGTGSAINQGLDSTWDSMITTQNKVEVFFLKLGFRFKALLKIIANFFLGIYDKISIFVLTLIKSGLNLSIVTVRVIKKLDRAFGKHKKEVKSNFDKAYEEKINEETQSDL